MCFAFPRKSYQGSIDSRAAESPSETTGGVGVGVLTRSQRRAMAFVPAEPFPQQSTRQDPEITTDQAQVQVQGQTFADLPELSEEDEDSDWESDIDLNGSESTTSFSGSVSASSASTNHSRKGMKRRQRSRDSQACSYSSRGLVQGTGSVPRVVTRRLAKIMSTGLDKAQAKLLRDRAEPFFFYSKSFCLKCPIIDESMQLGGWQHRSRP